MDRSTYIIRSMRDGLKAIPDLATPRPPDGLFGQKVIITTNNNIRIDSSKLDVEFDAPFDADPIPNECEVTIWNLSSNTINKLRSGDTLTVTAGYDVDTGVVFKGKIKKRQTFIEKPDKRTVLKVVDYGVGSKQFKQEFAAGTKAKTILRALIKKAKVKVAKLELPVNRTFKDNVTVEGRVNELIAQYAEMCGAYSYMVKNKLYIRNIKKKPALSVAVSETFGMVGSPESFTEEVVDPQKSQKKGEDVNKRQKGVKVKMLLNHRITTGVVITLTSANIKGKYTVREGRHTYNGTELITEVTGIA